MTPAPPVAIVSGSGLALHGVLDEVTYKSMFHEFPGMPSAGIEGHEGSFTVGLCGPRKVILQSGRLHFYEGIAFEEVTATVDALASLGARAILFTNAAGGLLPEMKGGDLMACEGLITMPYRGWPDKPDTLAPDFVPAGCEWTGRYAWVHGPSYETRAEIRLLRELGATAVGMSTAPEMHRCRQLGIRAGAISCITNNCATPQMLTHDHVVQTAMKASERLVSIIRRWLQTAT